MSQLLGLTVLVMELLLRFSLSLFLSFLFHLSFFNSLFLFLLSFFSFSSKKKGNRLLCLQNTLLEKPLFWMLGHHNYFKQKEILDFPSLFLNFFYLFSFSLFFSSSLLWRFCYRFLSFFFRSLSIFFLIKNNTLF